MKALHDAHVALFSEYLDVNPLAFYRFHLTRLSYTDPRIAAFYDPVTDTVGDDRVPLSAIIGRDVVQMAMQAARSGKTNAQELIIDSMLGAWIARAVKIDPVLRVGPKPPGYKSGFYLDVETAARGTVVYTGDGERLTKFDFDDLPIKIQASDTPETTPDGRPIREHNYLRLRKGYKR